MNSTFARRPAVGCIADDFTGATDLGSTLRREGLRVVQTVGVPDADVDVSGAHAIVVALKTRTSPVTDAVRESLAAFSWLAAAGAPRFYFKYCSTFDSRPDGNIGPVADALLDALGAPFTVACPAFPETGRTVYQGHLFVGDQLLSESPMSQHPLTPMTDSNVVRLLQRQSRLAVGLVPLAVVREGRGAIRGAIGSLQQQGVGYGVLDALTDRDLRETASAASDLPLLTGGSGLARGVPDTLRDAGLVDGRGTVSEFAPPPGSTVILSGSVSSATRRQVRAFGAIGRAFEIDPRAIATDAAVVMKTIELASVALADGPVLVHAALDPDAVEGAQRDLGVERSAALVEQALAEAARYFVARGVRRIIVAGGETSAAVVLGLGVRGLSIGPDIAPGVPWCTNLTEPRIALALKSGNFGADSFFLDALRTLGE